MQEFDIIRRYFAPLVQGFPASLGLRDDAAALDIPPGQQLIITKDAIAQGVHFIGNEEPAHIAQKLLRVNLSDLAAMSATPYAYFLAVMLPSGIDEPWIASFAQGLALDQQEFGIHLAGGDSIRSPTLSFSLTALGLVPSGQALHREGAQVGDIVYVTGTLGDSALGLAALKAGGGDTYLMNRYLLPQPRVALGRKLFGIASAAMDISDGLMQDLGHICAASHVGARIRRAALPLSAPARELPQAWLAAATGGDDYELLFTAPANMHVKIDALSQAQGVPITPIGVIMPGSEVQLLDEAGEVLPLPTRGFQHF